MTQTHDDVPARAGASESLAAISLAQVPTPFAGWLAMADPERPIDLRRLLPDVEVRVEPTSIGFSTALSMSEPTLVVLISPPADPGDLQSVASWLAINPDAHAVLVSQHQAVALRLHALELGFDDAVDLSSDPMEAVSYTHL